MIRRFVAWLSGFAALAGAIAAPVALYWLVIRPRLRFWGANTAERVWPLPGDDLVPEPRISATRSISIRATPAAIWPWIVQIGYGRAGWYSYDWLEGLMGAGAFVDGAHSTRRIVPELQDLAVGDSIPLGPEPAPRFVVTQIDPPRALVLGPDESPEMAELAASWAFVLHEHGDTTRLIVRFRLAYPPTLANHLLWNGVEFAHFVMERRMLRGIRARAEAATWRWSRVG